MKERVQYEKENPVEEKASGSPFLDRPRQVESMDRSGAIVPAVGKSYGRASLQLSAGSSRLRSMTASGETGIVQREEERKPNKTGLPDRLKEGIEQMSGYDLSEVRVNYNSPKPAQVNALAYTQGTAIEVAPRQERHLPHEAWHVVQQMQGRVREQFKVNGVGVNGDRRLEREADVMGTRAMTMRSDGIDRKVSAEMAPVGIAPPAGTTIQRLNEGDRVAFRAYFDRKVGEIGNPTSEKNRMMYAALEGEETLTTAKELTVRYVLSVKKAWEEELQEEEEVVEEELWCQSTMLAPMAPKVHAKKEVTNGKERIELMQGNQYAYYVGGEKKTDIYYKGDIALLLGYSPFTYNEASKAIMSNKGTRLYFSRDKRSQSAVLETKTLFYDEGNSEITKETGHSLIPSQTKEHTTNFVQDEGGRILVVEGSPVTGHEVIGDEKPVRFAGEVTVSGKKVIRTSNQSGHYRPDASDNPIKKVAAPSQPSW